MIGSRGDKAAASRPSPIRADRKMSLYCCCAVTLTAAKRPTYGSRLPARIDDAVGLITASFDPLSVSGPFFGVKLRAIEIGTNLLKALPSL